MSTSVWKGRKTIVEKELTRIYERDGVITPTAVIEEATDPDSPLHDYFDWDNESAAYKWRIDQARRLIREVRIDNGEEGKADISPPVFVHVGTAGGYLPTAVVVKNEMLLSSAIRELKSKLHGIGCTISLIQSMVETDDTRNRIATIAARVSDAEMAVDEITAWEEQPC